MFRIICMSPCHGFSTHLHSHPVYIMQSTSGRLTEKAASDADVGRSLQHLNECVQMLGTSVAESAARSGEGPLPFSSPFLHAQAPKHQFP